MDFNIINVRIPSIAKFVNTNARFVNTNEHAKRESHMHRKITKSQLFGLYNLIQTQYLFRHHDCNSHIFCFATER